MKRSSDTHAAECERLVPILIPAIREVARTCGYALGVHGSLRYDIDLIAVPWGPMSMSQMHVAERIIQCIAGIRTSKVDPPSQKPYGRLAWSIHLGGGPYVDLSVMPRPEDLTAAKKTDKRKKRNG